jgi:hypothetical protein
VGEAAGGVVCGSTSMHEYICIYVIDIEIKFCMS